MLAHRSLCRHCSEKNYENSTILERPRMLAKAHFHGVTSRFSRLMFTSRTALARSSATRPLLHTQYCYLQLIVHLRKCFDWFSVCNLSKRQFFVNIGWDTETFWTFTLFKPRSYGGAPWGGLYLLQQFWSRIKNKLHKNTKFLNAECYLKNLQNTSELFYHY